MKRHIAVSAVLQVITAVGTLSAQAPSFGIAVGTSFVGGSDSRVPVQIGEATVTGADRRGLHVRGMILWPSSSSLSFRSEIFYNRLTSGRNAIAIVAGQDAQPALVDRTIGLMNTFVASTSTKAAVAPYFLLSAGIFESRLVTETGPADALRTDTRDGLGLGVEIGAGINVRVLRQKFMLELRYGQALNSIRGIGFMPLTVGIQF
ncbi:MAG: hypothetical protein HKM89_09410 [Gemmatimonadales bacterium]|nr:hypothetical protein [Gemmatimonadales bacterium]